MKPTSQPTRPDRPEPAHFHLLNQLRGGAALAVVLYHLRHAIGALVEAQLPLSGFILPVLDRGWFGVDVFFLISGYGLASKLAGEHAITGTQGAVFFLWNRAWRIYPVYWFCCLFTIGLALVASRFNHLDWRNDLPTNLTGVLASVFILEPLTGTHPVLPIVTWALSCELGFYAIVAVGILLRPYFQDRWLVGAAAVLALAGSLCWNWEAGLVLAFWPEFACGLLVFTAVRMRAPGNAGTFRAAIGTILFLGAAAWMCGQTRAAVVAGLGLGLVLAHPLDNAFRHAPALRWLAWCGLISYPLFLLHIPVMSRLLNLGRRIIPAEGGGFFLIICVALTLAILTAWAVHQWVEQPLRTRGQRLPLLAA